MADLNTITDWLDTLLDIDAWSDFPAAQNGLQLDAGQHQIDSVGVAVDASLPTIRDAVSANIDLLVVHHGLFWGGLQPLTDRYGEAIRQLMQHGISLYSAHLPLDAHPEVGNNAVIVRELGLQDPQPFGHYEGRCIGWSGHWSRSFAELIKACAALVRGDVTGTGLADNRQGLHVAVVSGGAGNYWQEAWKKDCDVLLTGEARHHEYVAAAERDFALLTAGHYATETFGVRALGQQLSQQFALRCLPVGNPPAVRLGTK